MAFRSREYEDLQDFHARFKMYCNSRPGLLPNDLMQFRLNFLWEELQETKLASSKGDLAGVADGLADLVYVAIGTAEIMGLPWTNIWAAIQRANMAKIRAIPGKIEGTRPAKYDVVKPPGWEAPDIAKIIREAQTYDRDYAIIGRNH